MDALAGDYKDPSLDEKLPLVALCTHRKNAFLTFDTSSTYDECIDGDFGEVVWDLPYTSVFTKSKIIHKKKHSSFSGTASCMALWNKVQETACHIIDSHTLHCSVMQSLQKTPIQCQMSGLSAISNAVPPVLPRHRPLSLWRLHDDTKFIRHILRTL